MTEVTREQRDAEVIDCLTEIFDSDEEVSANDIYDVLVWILHPDMRDHYDADIRGMFESYSLMPFKEEGPT